MDDINFIKNGEEDQKKWWLEAESNPTPFLKRYIDV